MSKLQPCCRGQRAELVRLTRRDEHDTPCAVGQLAQLWRQLLAVAALRVEEDECDLPAAVLAEPALGSVEIGERDVGNVAAHRQHRRLGRLGRQLLDQGGQLVALVVRPSVLLEQADVEHAEHDGERPPDGQQHDQQNLHAAAFCLTAQLSRALFV